MAITLEQVKEIFSSLEKGSGDEFFDHVDELVNWTVEGTHPLAGNYTSKTAFRQATFARLNKVMSSGIALKIENILVDGNVAAVELSTKSVAKNGLKFNNNYCWICYFEDKKIVKVRAYLDSELVKQVIETNEGEEA